MEEDPDKSWNDNHRVLKTIVLFLVVALFYLLTKP